jgi:hypothetical protein
MKTRYKRNIAILMFSFRTSGDLETSKITSFSSVFKIRFSGGISPVKKKGWLKEPGTHEP